MPTHDAGCDPGELLLQVGFSSALHDAARLGGAKASLRGSSTTVRGNSFTEPLTAPGN
jgi:hypothetical protein